MHYDELGLIVSDTSGPPSCFGDSCAETGRVVHLGCLLGLQDGPAERLLHFVTSGGYVRHPSPTLPYDWRETDFSSDQALPLYLAWRQVGVAQAQEMKERIKAAGWRTGNGDLVSPYFFAALIDSKLLMSLVCFIGAMVFKIPFRWSDSKKAFESNADATGDYLNYFHCLPFAYGWVRRLVGKSTLSDKIIRYYSNESNCAGLLARYGQAITAVYNG